MWADREPLDCGNNFCSSVRREVVVVRGGTRVVVKKFARSVLEWKLLQRELNVYRHILPQLDQLNYLFFSGEKLFPRFLKSLNNPHTLLIEDLKGYRTKDVLSMKNVEVVLDKLSLFHALGFILKAFQPALVEKFATRKSTRLTPPEWLTIIHSDCWFRNFMFSRSGAFKFIDFGFTKLGHGLHDLLYFLHTSVNVASIDEIHYFCSYYFSNLQKRVRAASVSPKDEGEFWHELRRQSRHVLPLATFVLKRVTRGVRRRQQLLIAAKQVEILQNSQWVSTRCAIVTRC